MVLIFSVLIGITLDLTGAKPAVKYYATKYDHIDVETILNNRRMVNYYSACLLSKGPCPPEGVELKRILPEALQSNCGRCTEKQATVALRVIKRLRKEYPKVWSQLSQMWDPDGFYVRRFESGFGSSSPPPKPIKEITFIANRFGSGDDEPTNNSIDGSPLETSTKKLTSTTISQPDSTTHTVISSSPNNTQSISISTSTKTILPSKPSSPDSTTSTTPSASTASTIQSSSTASTIQSTSTSELTSSLSTSLPSSALPSISTTTSKLTPIPGLVPLNTFFTNPPIPIRPIVNLNIGANIGATVSGLVRGLGVIGSRVMETGAEIAEVVIKNFARPLPL